MANNTSPLVPTYHGHINSTIDALILFEATLSGQLNHVPRRPHDRERSDLIKSGNVFIYEEHASGIKRWTDGVSWSPSRILGNFLIYRELEKPFPPGEKKRALKKSKKVPQGVTKIDTSRNNTMSFSGAMDPEAVAKDSERALIGSLVDSYPFKDGGLVKKTISVSIRGIPHHLVSYYTVEDVVNRNLIEPSQHLELRPVLPRHELITSQNFRAPVEEGDPSSGNDRIRHAYIQGTGYAPPPSSVLQRAMSLPSFSQVQLPPQFAGAQPFAYAPQQLPHPQHAQHHAQLAHHQHVQQQQHHIQQQQHQNPYVTTMAPSTSPMPYSVAPAGNYSLEPSRSRFPTSSISSAHEFPRAMPTDSSPRRHSTFEAPKAMVLGNMTLQPVAAEARGMPAPYNIQPGHFYPTSRPSHMNSNGHGLASHEHDYSHSIRHKIEEVDEENDEDDDNNSPQYALEDTPEWAFNGLGGTHNHHMLDGTHSHQGLVGNQNHQGLNGNQDPQGLDTNQDPQVLEGAHSHEQYFSTDGSSGNHHWQNGN